MRPSEGGRNVVVRRGPEGETADVTPQLFNVRTRVHEYGGGAFLVSDGVVYFSNFEDQRLYRQRPGREPEPITPEAAVRYADGVMDSTRDRIICIREDHRGEGRRSPRSSALAWTVWTVAPCSYRATTSTPPPGCLRTGRG